MSIKEYKFSEYGRYFQWIPTELDIGKQEIIIRLTDERGISNLYTHNLLVFNNPCNQCNDGIENSPPDTTDIKINNLQDQPCCERSWKRDETVCERADGSVLSERDFHAINQ